MTDTVDTTVLPGLLTALRLPSIARHWQHYVTVADREGWPAARLLGTLLELEVAERAQRRIQRHQAESGLPPGKTFATFDFNAAAGLRKAHVLALASGDHWIRTGVKQRRRRCLHGEWRL